MDETELIAALKAAEADATSYYDSEIARDQAEALDRYHAKPFPNESTIDGSRVVTHDIEDTINWIMPHLMRVFLQSDELITCEDDGLPDGSPDLQTAADYLRHVLFKDNDGATFIHDFAFDGLLQKIAIARVDWEGPKRKAPRIMDGVPATRLPEIEAAYEVMESEQGEPIMIGEEQVPTFALKVRPISKKGRAVIECIPPEEFRVSRQAKSIKEADYHGWRREVFLAPIVAQFPELEDDLRSARTAPGGFNENDPRQRARFPDEPHRAQSYTDSIGRTKVEERIEYFRCDYDGDGHVELRRIRRVGDVVLENDEVDESEFSSWSPIRVSHRMIGRSLADTLIDLQKIRTMLTRAALDGLARSLQPRYGVNTRMLAKDGSTLDALLDHQIGGVVPVEGDVREALQELTTTNVAPDALAAIEYFDRRAEEASGVSKHSQGIAPEAITKTAQGIEMLQAAANARIELVARWLAIGLQDALEKLLRLIMERQDQPRVIKVTGRQIEVDPSRWSEDMTVSVHVGMAAESREARMQHLLAIAAKQEAMIQASPQNPIAGLPELRNSYARMAEAMGFRSATPFFKEIPPDWQPPEPGPDPKIALEQQKAEAQKAASEQKLALEAQMSEARLAMEERLAVMKMELERELALMKMQAEQQLAAVRMAQEREIARETTATRADTEQKKAEMSTFRPGGKLDA